MALLAHRGAELIDLPTLDLIPLPETTETYQPVSHHTLASTLNKIGRDILTGYEFAGEQYAIARAGNQLFGIITFKRNNSDMGLSIGFRNSYDKSMSIGLAIGANVFVCDNLALSGQITVMKKHTMNVWNTLEDLAISTLYRSQAQFDQIQADSEAMRTMNLNDRQAYMLLGLLFGTDVLSPRQLTTAVKEWNEPAHTAFQPRNLWSLYNGCTEALKSCPPLAVMEKHISLHDTVNLELRNGLWQ